MENMSNLEYLLDRSCEFDLRKAQLLDQLTFLIVNNRPESAQAHQIWKALKEDHYFWYNSEAVLRLSELDQTKVFMLIILEEAIRQKWYVLSQTQREAIKAYIVSLVLDLGGVENLPKSSHHILTKANSTLVQIVKYEWNSGWKTFINDICSSSTKDMNICENNFYILKMLSEEIFDYSKNQMTQQQIGELKAQMNNDFTMIFELCKLILQNAPQAKPSLVKACLDTLNAFLTWIPIYYVIYTDLIDKLISLLPSDYLRNHSLICLVEIASLEIDHTNIEERNKFMAMLANVTTQLNKLIPLSESDQNIHLFLKNIKKKFRNIFEILARGIANFYSEFFKHQSKWLGQAVIRHKEEVYVCHLGFKYLTMMMRIDDDQVFKIAVEFFHLYIGEYIQNQDNFLRHVESYGNSLESIYPEIFDAVMKVIVFKMAKPFEVLIYIDEDGVPAREELENTQSSSLYETMRELVSYLVKNDWHTMKNFIITSVEKQIDQKEFNFHSINSLSWVTGSLSGLLSSENQEKAFFMKILRTLLQLCEQKHGKQNKAVIASCIMYVVGQYPSFLKSNWTFLRTVIKKLFDFIKEDFSGIMEMSCNTFLKITKNTSQQFVLQQANQHEPIICEILRKTPELIKQINKETYQMVFYQSLGYAISMEPILQTKLQLISEILGFYFIEFNKYLAQAEKNPNILKEESIEKNIIYFLKINQMLINGVGREYALFLEKIAADVNKLYLYYSEQVSAIVVNNSNTNIFSFVTVKLMRSVKKEILKLYICLLERSNDLTFQQQQYLLNTFIFPLGTLLQNFNASIPELKQQEFVMLFTKVLEKLSGCIDLNLVSKLVEMIFGSSIPLITNDFNSFPEIRLNFFMFLKALIRYHFLSLEQLPQAMFNTLIECIIWSMKHQLANYSDIGLQLLVQLIENVNNSSPVIINIFYGKYYMKFLTEIFDLLTDGYHHTGGETQIKIIFILLQLVNQNIITHNIAYDHPEGPFNNPEYLYNFMVQKFTSLFNTLGKAETAQRIQKWFTSPTEKDLNEQITDYLVLINRFNKAEIQPPK